jgi:hypothetical protein
MRISTGAECVLAAEKVIGTVLYSGTKIHMSKAQTWCLAMEAHTLTASRMSLPLLTRTLYRLLPCVEIAKMGTCLYRTKTILGQYQAVYEGEATMNQIRDTVLHHTRLTADWLQKAYAVKAITTQATIEGYGIAAMIMV